MTKHSRHIRPIERFAESSDVRLATRAETGQRILRRIQQTGRATVDELSSDLNVSSVTVHRHLARLEGAGLIARRRGAAEIIVASALAGSGFADRLAAASAAKDAIALRALDYLPASGGAIFIDGSTTCLALARQIARSVTSELTIVTTSPALLYEFVSPTVRVVALPGELDQLVRVVGGPWTVEFLSTINLQAAFISGIGLTLDAGLTSERRTISDVLKEVVSRSPHTYMLVDSSKFGRTALLHIAWPWHVSAVITDFGLSDDVQTAYSEHAVNMVLA